MADVTVTVDSSQVAAAASQINNLGAAASRMGGGGSAWPPGWQAWGTAGGGGAGGAGGGGGGGAAAAGAAGQFNQLAAAQNNVAAASQRAGINIGNMLERMALRMGILFVVHEVIKQVIHAFEEAANAQTDFIHIQEMTAQSTEQTEKTFEALKRIAHDTGQDLEKTVIPAFVKLTEAGFDPEAARDFDRVVSSVLEKTGINLTDIAEKAEIGALGFADIAKAAAGLGNVPLGKWAQSWMAASAAEKSYEQDLARNHELTQRAVQDAERLAGAHEEFASSTGLASAAFEAFQKVQIPAHGAIAARVEIPKALADLPGGGRAFGQLLGEMQKRYGEGISQIAKEENLPAALVRAGVRAGISGFDEKSLLAAQKRGVEEQNIGRIRKEQDERYERTKAFEDARINANELIKQKMHDQVAAAKDLDKVLQSVNGHLQQMVGWWHEGTLSMGNVMQGWADLASGKRPETAERARNQVLAGKTALENLWAMARLPGSPPGVSALAGASGTPQDAGKQLANPIVEKLDQLMSMLRGHG